MTTRKRRVVGGAPFMQVKSITKAATWEGIGVGPGSLYAGQVRFVTLNDERVELMLAQGGPEFLPPFGDPLSVWVRRKGEKTFTFLRYLIYRDDDKMLQLFPHVGSTAACSWLIDEQGMLGKPGLAHIFFSPAIIDPNDPGSFHLRNFVLAHVTTEDFVTVQWVDYKRDHPHPLVRKAALYFGDFPQAVTTPDAAFGISGACPLLTSDGTLYLMLKLYSGRGQKNGLARLANSTGQYATWFDRDTFRLCESGRIPSELITPEGNWGDVWGVGNPFYWAVDSIYETPDPWRSRGVFIGFTGDPSMPLAAIFSDDLRRWSEPLQIDGSRAWQYRFFNPAARTINAAAGGTPDNPNALMSVYDIELAA